MQTGFEATGQFSTMEYETTFLTTLAAQHPDLMTHEVIGTSTWGGFDLHRVVITEAPHDVPTVLVLGGVHGSEPAGRETALTFIRDFVTATDPAWVALRRNARVVVLPNCNPSGRSTNTKQVHVTETTVRDIQGDMLALTLVESQRIAETIAQYQPVFTLDCHEYWDYGGRGMIEGRPSYMLPEYQDITWELFYNVRDAWDTAGVPHGTYDVLGGPQGRGVSAVVSMLGSTFFLIESCVNAPNGAAGRISDYAVAVDAIVQWVAQNLDRLTAQRARSLQDRTHAIDSHSTPVDLRMGTVLPAWPLGYRDLSAWPPAFTMYGVEGDQSFVSTDQQAGFLVMRMLDEAGYEQRSSPVHADCERVMPAPVLPRPTGEMVMLDGREVRPAR